MSIEFLRKNLAAKISNLLDTEVPLFSRPSQIISSNSAKLNFDGMEIEEEKLQQCYNFIFSFFSADQKFAENQILKVEHMLRTSFPEIISDGENKFCIRYINIQNSSCRNFDSSGVFLYKAELNFSVIM